MHVARLGPSKVKVLLLVDLHLLYARFEGLMEPKLLKKPRILLAESFPLQIVNIPVE